MLRRLAGYADFDCRGALRSLFRRFRARELRWDWAPSKVEDVGRLARGARHTVEMNPKLSSCITLYPAPFEHIVQVNRFVASIVVQAPELRLGLIDVA